MEQDGHRPSDQVTKCRHHTCGTVLKESQVARRVDAQASRDRVLGDFLDLNPPSRVEEVDFGTEC